MPLLSCYRETAKKRKLLCRKHFKKVRCENFAKATICVSGSVARIRRSFSEPALPSRKSFPVEPQPGGVSSSGGTRSAVLSVCRTRGRDHPHHALHLGSGPGYPRRGRQAGQKASGHVWVPGLELPLQNWNTNCTLELWSSGALFLLTFGYSHAPEFYWKLPLLKGT